ncbi:LysR family transcriptional regulator [Vibrio sp. HA2012]|uniref:LysR family transcriptional regulator n=1 Tax=Vibrio sp. HA2012 TaxID=1971595 RepID=UPI000C2CAEB3|nr:LysR family transcriptional regulator [Vibrio sp. HA2012]PJC85672.1 LysR family transcriptional regulator [Vibrio sp. HA2012]
MITELKTFLAVAKYKSFAKAGEHIGLSQSAVSAQMQRLEQALSRTLFDRGPKSIWLNDAGWLLIPEAESIIRQWSKIRDESVKDTGTLRIGSIHSVQTSFVTPAITRFIHQFPQWKIQVIPDISISLLSKIEAGELDAAILIKPSFALPEHLIWKSISEEPFCLIVPGETDSEAWKSYLQTFPFIRYYKGSFGGRIVDTFLNKHDIPVQEVIEIDDIQSMVDLVRRGHGVALVPWPHDTPEGCTCISLGQLTFYREIGIVFPRQSPKRTHVDCFVSSITNITTRFKQSK